MSKNTVRKSGRTKRMGAKAVGNLGSKRPPGRAKGGAKRTGKTGIKSPSMNAGKRGKGSAPMLNAMRADPGIVASKGSHALKRKNATSPASIDRLFNGMRGD